MDLAASRYRESLLVILTLAARHLGMEQAFLATADRAGTAALTGDVTCVPPDPAAARACTSWTQHQNVQVISADAPLVDTDLLRQADQPAQDGQSSQPYRSYVGVPVHRPGGRVYSVLGCVSSEARPDLGAAEVAYLTLLAEVLESSLASTVEQDAVEHAFADLIATRSLRMAFQPIIDLTDGACRAVEALARFPAALGEPSVAFDNAERVGLRADVEGLAVDQALAALPQLHPRQSVGVNCSPAAACEFDRHAAATGVPLDRVILEITEHTAVASYADIRDHLQPLRQEGLRIAIDDAGAGFASLRHVIELQPDIVKIDRSLICGAPHDSARRAVITTFVLLALEVGATVIAEGIETAAELDVARTLGVDAGQGFLLARPTTDLGQVAGWGARGLLPTRATSTRTRRARSMAPRAHAQPLGA